MFETPDITPGYLDAIPADTPDYLGASSAASPGGAASPTSTPSLHNEWGSPPPPPASATVPVPVPQPPLQPASQTAPQTEPTVLSTEPELPTPPENFSLEELAEESPAGWSAGSKLAFAALLAFGTYYAFTLEE